MKYQGDLFGGDRPAFTIRQLVDEIAPKVPQRENKDEWRKEVIFRCSIEGPIFEAVVQRIADFSKRLKGAPLVLASIEYYVGEYMLSEGIHMGSIDRELRKWQERNGYDDDDDEQGYQLPSRTI